MINKVSFTGRETMLTDKLAKPVEQQVIKASTYIEEKVLPKVHVENMYSNPFALINAPSTPVVEHVRPVGVGDNLHFFG